MRKIAFAVLVAAAAALPSSASAQRAQPVRFGAQLSYGSDIDLGIGGRVRIPLPQVYQGVGLDGSFDYFFPGGNLTFWEINADGNYTFPVKNSSIEPYVGAGINYAHVSADCGGLDIDCSDSNAGLNVLGGARFGVEGKHWTPFAEARGELRSGGKFVVTGGILF